MSENLLFWKKVGETEALTEFREIIEAWMECANYRKEHQEYRKSYWCGKEIAYNQVIIEINKKLETLKE